MASYALKHSSAVVDHGSTDDNHLIPSPNDFNGHDLIATVNGLEPVTTDQSGSPAADVTHVKIDTVHQESDVRHESLPVAVISPQSAEVSSSVTHIDQHHSPNGLSLPPTDSPNDVVMDQSSGPNTSTQQDVVMEDLEQYSSPFNADADHSVPKPPTSPSVSASSPEMPAAATGTTQTDDTECLKEDNENPPPAKRARMHLDATQASIANSPNPPETPNPTGVTNGAPAPNQSASLDQAQSTLSPAQYRFALATLRTLKKLKDAAPFLRPVDPIALNIPHYPTVVKHPMDFSTIERKLSSSNPVKPDPIPQNPRYFSADAFISDIRLIFHNCLTFNGPEHLVTAMGKRVEEVFDKQLKQMPPPLEPKPVVKKEVPRVPTPPTVVATTTTTTTTAAAAKKPLARRPSTSLPVIRRSETETSIGRPKREIHPPPPKDLPYADAPKKTRRTKRVKDDGTSEQLKYCAKLLTDLHRKQHYGCAHPFYEPVDWQKLDIPTYPKIVKKPMDLSTMRRKLENQDYSSAQKFYDDFKLMIRNCFLFNPVGTPVNQAGIELQRLFDEKWKHLPPLREVSEGEEDAEDEADSDAERIRAIAVMESQIETMRGSIAALKKPPKKEKKQKEKRDKAPVPSTSKTNKASKGSGSSKKKAKNKPIADNDMLSFEQKKDLSEAIQRLDGTKLERVIQIIHEGVPEIRDSTEEIELEIDMLPSTVLAKLYNFVLRPLRMSTTKRNRSGKGTGTGGLKRKSMDEDLEAEKIRRLEERMKMFEEGASGSAALPSAGLENSDHSGSSDDSSSESGSD